MNQQPQIPNNVLYVKNPETGRSVKIGSKTYNDLVAKQIIVPQVNNLANIQQQLNEGGVQKVLNPLTRKYINKEGKLYKSLKRSGVVFNDDDLVPLPNVVIPAPPHIHTRVCNNQQTFLLQEDVKDIAEDDFIITPSGYCFSIDELVQWLKSESFNNKDPYDVNKEMFTKPSIAFWKKYPQIISAINAYFLKAKNERMVFAKTIRDTIHVLYMIGNTGRICYFDNMSSRSLDSSTFEYSIEAIANLTELLESLPQSIRRIFLDMNSNGVITLEKTIQDANNGAVCIHGFGMNCLNIFIEQFTYLEAIYKSIKYEPIKTGIYFIKDTLNSRIMLLNMDNRTTFNRNHHYYTQIVTPLVSKIKKNSSMIWEQKLVKMDGLTPIYIEKCLNEPEMSTLETHDTWENLEHWRKFRLVDDYCFDIIFLIKVITDQLNTTYMTNPQPNYPKNPFTNKILSMRDLLNLRRRIFNNFLNISSGLMSFLFNSEILWTDTHTYATSNSWISKCITFFEKEMRYERYLYSRGTADEGHVINGRWVEKKIVMGSHERMVIEYLNTMNHAVLQRVAPHVNKLDYYVSYKALPFSLVHAYESDRILKK